MTTKPILLVEDTPDDAELTTMSLKRTGLLKEVVLAEDGLEALDYLFGNGRFASRNPQDTPALVLLDIKMPRLDGIEVLQRLRADERTSLLPIVMLTTSTVLANSQPGICRRRPTSRSSESRSPSPPGRKLPRCGPWSRPPLPNGQTALPW